MFHGSVHLLTVAFTFTTRRPLSIHRSIVQLGDSCFHPSLHMSHSVCDDSSSTSRLTACSGLDLTRVFLIAQSSDFLDHDESPLHPPASHYHPSDSRGASAGFEPTPLEKTSSVPTITPRGRSSSGAIHLTSTDFLRAELMRIQKSQLPLDRNGSVETISILIKTRLGRRRFKQQTWQFYE